MTALYEDADGHWVLEGSRWHYPAMGDPTRCAVRGCERILGQQRAAEEAEEAETPGEPETRSSDSAAA